MDYNYTMQEVIAEVRKVKPELFPFMVCGKYNYYIALCFGTQAHKQHIEGFITSYSTYEDAKTMVFLSEENKLLFGEAHDAKNLTDFDAMIGCYVDIKEKHNVDFKNKFDEEIK